MNRLAEAPPGEKFVGIRRAASIARRSPFTIQRLAIAGKIRVVVEPGSYPQFCVSDLHRIERTEDE